MAELITSQTSVLLHWDGFLYYKHSGNIASRAYWRCKRMGECNARLVTVGPDLRITKGKREDHTSHAPSWEEVEAAKLVSSLKRKAAEHPEAPPAQLLRTELRNVPSGTCTACDLLFFLYTVCFTQARINHRCTS